MILEYNSTTTLRRIRKAKPCEDGWKKLLSRLGKTEADDEPLDLLTVLDSNGFEDALWVLSYAMPDDRLARHFQAWCAERVLHIYEREYPGDSRIRDQIAMLRNDAATDDERERARRAAWSAAAEATAWAANAAAWSTAAAEAEAAARAAAWAARDIAEDAEAAQEAQLRKMLTQEATQ
jgi:hypothetical protein